MSLMRILIGAIQDGNSSDYQTATLVSSFVHFLHAPNLYFQLMICLLFVSIEMLLEGENAMLHYRTALKIIRRHSQRKALISKGSFPRDIPRSSTGEELYPIYLQTQRIELIDACKRMNRKKKRKSQYLVSNSI